MLHLGDALGFSNLKRGSAKEVQLDNSTIVLTDLRDSQKFRFTSWQVAHNIRALAQDLYKHRLSLKGDAHWDTIVTVFPQSCDSLFAILAVTGLSWAAAPLAPDDKCEGYLHNYRVMNPTLVLIHISCVEARLAAEEVGIPVLTFDWVESGEVGLTPACRFLSGTHEPVQTDLAVSDSTLCPHETDVCLRYRKPGSDLIVPITHRNLAVSVANVQRCYGFQGVMDVRNVQGEEIDTAYCVAPIHQIHGLAGVCLPMLSMQAGVVIGPFDPSQFWSHIKEYRITWTSLLPHMVFDLMDANQITERIEHLRFIRVTSVHLNVTLTSELEKLSGGVPVLCAYSNVMATHQITSNGYPTFDDRIPGSVGIPTGCEIAILNDDRECVARDVEGEVWIRGHNVIDAFEGENANATDDDYFVLHNAIEWSLAKPASFVSSAKSVGSGQSRFFSEWHEDNTSSMSAEKAQEASWSRAMHSEGDVIINANVADAVSSLSESESSEEIEKSSASSGQSADLLEFVAEGGSNQAPDRNEPQHHVIDYQKRQLSKSTSSDFHEPKRETSRQQSSGGVRGQKIYRFASGLQSYAEDFPLRFDQLISPIPLIMRWVKTNDRGRIDAQGRLYITQRAPQIIRVGAHPVSCDKVERRMRKIQGIAEALVVGIADKRQGQKIVAIVSLSQKVLKVSEILEQMAHKYPEYEVPSEILILESLPDPQDIVNREKLLHKIYEVYQT